MQVTTWYTMAVQDQRNSKYTDYAFMFAGRQFAYVVKFLGFQGIETNIIEVHNVLGGWYQLMEQSGH
jgi:hypothetical protein